MSATLVIDSPTDGFRVTLASPGRYICDAYRACDSKVFDFLTPAILWGMRHGNDKPAKEDDNPEESDSDMRAALTEWRELQAMRDAYDINDPKHPDVTERMLSRAEYLEDR